MQSSGGGKNSDGPTIQRTERKGNEAGKLKGPEMTSPRWTFHTMGGLISQEKACAFHSRCVGKPLMAFKHGHGRTQFISFFLNLFFLYSRFFLSILYKLVYTCQSQSPNSSYHHHHPAFPLWCPYVCSLHLCLCFCLANQFICTIFLHSTYMC